MLKWVENTKVVVILFLGFYYMTTAGQLPLLSGVTSQDAVASIKEELCGVTVSYEVVRQHLVVRHGLAAKVLAHGTHG